MDDLLLVASAALVDASLTSQSPLQSTLGLPLASSAQLVPEPSELAGPEPTTLGFSDSAGRVPVLRRAALPNFPDWRRPSVGGAPVTSEAIFFGSEAEEAVLAALIRRYCCDNETAARLLRAAEAHCQTVGRRNRAGFNYATGRVGGSEVGARRIPPLQGGQCRNPATNCMSNVGSCQQCDSDAGGGTESRLQGSGSSGLQEAVAGIDPEANSILADARTDAATRIKELEGVRKTRTSGMQHYLANVLHFAAKTLVTSRYALLF